MGDLHDTIPEESQSHGYSSTPAPAPEHASVSMQPIGSAFSGELIYSPDEDSRHAGLTSSTANYKKQSVRTDPTTGATLLRYLRPDGSEEMVSAAQFKSRMAAEYPEAAKPYMERIRELDEVRSSFNDVILDTSKEGTRGFLLPSDYTPKDGKVDKKIQKRKDKIRIPPISGEAVYSARTAYHELLRLRPRIDYSAASGKDGVGTNASYIPTLSPKEAEALIDQNLRAFTQFNTIEDAAKVTLPAAFRASTGTLLTRFRNELDLMKDDWKEYDRSWLETLSMSGDMDDSDMEKMIQELSDTFGLLESFQTVFTESDDFDPGQLKVFSKASKEFTQFLIIGRYALNKILVAQESAGWHTLYNVYGIAGSIASDLLGPAGSILGGGYFSGMAEIMHQNENLETYEKLGLEYDPDDSPLNLDMVHLTAGIGAATGGVMAFAAKPLSKVVVSGVKNVVAKTLAKSAEKSVPTIAKNATKGGVRETVKKTISEGTENVIKDGAAEAATNKSIISTMKVIPESTGGSHSVTYGMMSVASDIPEAIASNSASQVAGDVVGLSSGKLVVNVAMPSTKIAYQALSTNARYMTLREYLGHLARKRLTKTTIRDLPIIVSEDVVVNNASGATKALVTKEEPQESPLSDINFIMGLDENERQEVYGIARAMLLSEETSESDKELALEVISFIENCP